MILSDRSIREAMAAGRIVIEPLGDNAIQPSSVDLRVGNRFRVFANHRHPYIDVRAEQELTELVAVSDAEPFILHPGEFVLGTTYEKVTIPDDLVARLEGKSSLGRLGLLIHSSLPGDEPVPFLHDGQVRLRRIGDIVGRRLAGGVVSFDPETFGTTYSAVTGWYEGPADRIYEVVLASGRSVRVTAGHNLFSLDRDGRLAKVRTGQLRHGTMVAVPRRLPAADLGAGAVGVVRLPAEHARADLVVSGHTVAERPTLHAGRVQAVRVDAGTVQGSSERGRGPLPASVAGQLSGDRVELSGAEHHGDLAWDPVVEVRDTGRVEPVYDLEVRPGGRRIENFLAGSRGVYVSNTAGFVDAGWSGHLTLELSNVANLPITLYPRMKIGQLAFFQLDRPADQPYGSQALGSKYQGQVGPTASRYFENFTDTQ